MRNKQFIVIILETHLLYFPNSSLLDLNNNFLARIVGSLGSQTEGKFLHQVLIPCRQSPQVLHEVHRFFHNEATSLHYPSHPITNLSVSLWNLQAWVSTLLSQGLESSHFFARPPAPPYSRKASFSSLSKSGFQPCILGKTSAVSHPNLQAELVILFLGRNRP